MQDIEFTIHAMKRIQQRGFDNEIIDLLLKFGDYRNAGDDCQEVTLRPKSIVKLLNSSKLSTIDYDLLKKHIDRLTKKAIIIADDAIITLYHINRRRKTL